MKFKLFSAVILGGCISFAAACTVTTVDGLGGSGIGGDTSDDVTSSKAASGSTTHATGTGVTSSVTSTGSSGACDTGVPGDYAADPASAEGMTCETCITCTQGAGQCKSAWDAYGADPQYADFSACAQAATTQAEFDACFDTYPTAGDAYTAALNCSVCMDCTANCGAATNCNGG